MEGRSRSGDWEPWDNGFWIRKCDCCERRAIVGKLVEGDGIYKVGTRATCECHHHHPLPDVTNG